MLACYHGQLVSANLTTNEHQNFYRYEYFKVCHSFRSVSQTHFPVLRGGLRCVALASLPQLTRHTHMSIQMQDANGRLRNPYDEGCARNCMSRLVYAEAPPVVPDSGAHGRRGAGGVGRRQRRVGGKGISSSSSLRPVLEEREKEEGEEEEGLLSVV